MIFKTDAAQGFYSLIPSLPLRASNVTSLVNAFELIGTYAWPTTDANISLLDKRAKTVPKSLSVIVY